VIIDPRLRWTRWRLRNEAVPPAGRPLSARETFWLSVAEFALRAEAGTRRGAVDEEGAELLAAGENGGPWWC
jgi:hypothetical protein